MQKNTCFGKNKESSTYVHTIKRSGALGSVSKCPEVRTSVNDGMGMFKIAMKSKRKGVQ
jgi:hypothetical protein